MVAGGDSHSRYRGVGNAGFTLIELLIVVAIVGVLAATAVPQYLEMVRRAQETAAIAYMKSWVAAQEYYKEKYGWYADADDQLVKEQLIPVTLAKDGSRAGYNYSIDSPAKAITGWWGKGWPVKASNRSRYFYIDQTGTLRYEVGKQASSKSPTL